jgi:hypothetical protein
MKGVANLNIWEGFFLSTQAVSHVCWLKITDMLETLYVP